MRSAASSIQRKPPQHSSGAPVELQPSAGYFKVSHEWVDLIVWVGTPGCEQYCLLKILSLQNQRAARLTKAGRKQDGHTDLIELEDLVKSCQGRWERRMVEISMANLLESGAITRLSRQQALDMGHLNRPERSEKGFLYQYRCATEEWEALAKKAKAAEARRQAKKKEREEDPGRPDVVGEIAQRLMPGVPAEPIPLPPAARLQLRKCKILEFDLDTPIPLEVRHLIDGDVLRCRIAAISADAFWAGSAAGVSREIRRVSRSSGPQVVDDVSHPSNAEEINCAGGGETQQPIGPSRRALVAQALAALNPPVVLPPRLLHQVVENLGDAPPALLAVQVRVRRRDLGDKFGPGLCPLLAKDARELYEHHGDQVVALMEAAAVAPPAAAPVVRGGRFNQPMVQLSPEDQRRDREAREKLRAMRNTPRGVS